MCGTYPSNLFHISRRIIVASSTDGTQITSKGGGTTRHTQNIAPMLKGDTHTLGHLGWTIYPKHGDTRLLH